MRHLPPLRCLSALLIGVSMLAVAAGQDATPIPQPAPRPMPSSIHMDAGLQLELYFPALKQGGVGLLRLSGGNMQSARADFLGKDLPLFQAPGDAWYGLIGAGISTTPGEYPLTVLAARGAGATRFERRVEVRSGNFIMQDFALGGSAGRLVSDAAEREAAALVLAITAEYQAQPQWGTQGFALPLAGALTSPFGAIRTLNDEFSTRHMGWDQNAPEGSPVRAMAAGTVAAAEDAPAARAGIYGKFVMLDHGYTVFSSYAHLSAIFARAGQRVEAGQVIGLSGNTGRSSGPHLHWEVLLHGERVDGVAFLKQWLPPMPAAGSAGG